MNQYLLLVNLLILMPLYKSEGSFSPADFAWKNRMIIINGDCDCLEWFSDELKKDLSERKLLVFHFNEGSLIKSNFKGELKTADFLKLNPNKNNQSITWVLVGLDGGVKKSENTRPKPGEVFRIIDSMPMRQSELVKKGK